MIRSTVRHTRKSIRHHVYCLHCSCHLWQSKQPTKSFFFFPWLNHLDWKCCVARHWLEIGSVDGTCCRPGPIWSWKLNWEPIYWRIWCQYHVLIHFFEKRRHVEYWFQQQRLCGDCVAVNRWTQTFIGYHWNCREFMPFVICALLAAKKKSLL